MSHADMLLTAAERATTKLTATGAARVWSETRDDVTYVHASYGTTPQARAAALAFRVPTFGVTFPVQAFLDRHTTVVIHDRPRGAHRAALPGLTGHHTNGSTR